MVATEVAETVTKLEQRQVELTARKRWQQEAELPTGRTPRAEGAQWQGLEVRALRPQGGRLRDMNEGGGLGSLVCNWQLMEHGRVV